MAQKKREGRVPIAGKSRGLVSGGHYRSGKLGVQCIRYLTRKRRTQCRGEESGQDQNKNEKGGEKREGREISQSLAAREEAHTLAVLHSKVELKKNPNGEKARCEKKKSYRKEEGGNPATLWAKLGNSLENRLRKNKTPLLLTFLVTGERAALLGKVRLLLLTQADKTLPKTNKEKKREEMPKKKHSRKWGSSKLTLPAARQTHFAQLRSARDHRAATRENVQGAAQRKNSLPELKKATYVWEKKGGGERGR